MSKLMRIGTFIMMSTLLASFSCNRKSNSLNDINNNTMIKEQKEIFFAGGCFWGTEHFFKQVRGVTTTTVGYANGKEINPSYNDVTTGNTGFAETVKVTYDPEIISLELLIDLYLKTIDPTSLNKQGNDRGTQYRTGIYYNNKKDEKLIKEKINLLAKQYKQKIVIESEYLSNFYNAESYHQNYLAKNPGGYCHISPDLFEFAKKSNPESEYTKKVILN